MQVIHDHTVKHDRTPAQLARRAVRKALKAVFRQEHPYLHGVVVKTVAGGPNRRERRRAAALQSQIVAVASDLVIADAMKQERLAQAAGQPMPMYEPQPCFLSEDDVRREPSQTGDE